MLISNEWLKEYVTIDDSEKKKKKKKKKKKMDIKNLVVGFVKSKRNILMPIN